MLKLGKFTPRAQEQHSCQIGRELHLTIVDVFPLVMTSLMRVFCSMHITTNQFWRSLKSSVSTMVVAQRSE